MNTFRANISYLIQDGNSIPMSALQYKYYEMYGDKDICTLENLRKLGPRTVSNHSLKLRVGEATQ